MPCYDKKLEAARDDFVFSVEHREETVNEASGRAVAEVDSVLTTGEVLDLIEVLQASVLLHLRRHNVRSRICSTQQTCGLNSPSGVSMRWTPRWM